MNIEVFTDKLLTQVAYCARVDVETVRQYLRGEVVVDPHLRTCMIRSCRMLLPENVSATFIANHFPLRKLTP
jgi:hypothetical protein